MALLRPLEEDYPRQAEWERTQGTGRVPPADRSDGEGALGRGATSHNKNHKKGAAKDERKIFKNPPMVPFKPKAAEPSEAKEGAPALEDRDFKVSYASDQGVGYWFGHFAGQFLSRQLEIPPKGSMIRMKADKDYDKMENILLEESGLTRRKGAEILETEFNLVWDGKRSP